MKVKFQIMDADPSIEWMNVKYENDEGQCYHRNIKQVDWSAEAVLESIKAYGPEITAFWNRTKDVDVDATMKSVQMSGEFDCEPENFFVVMPDPPQIRDAPEYDAFTHRIEQLPFEMGDEWIEWDIIELTQEEKDQMLQFAEEQARGERNIKLLQSDFFNFPDACVGNVQDWLDYRQALRDVPEQPNFPKAIIWPERPEVIKEEFE